MPVYRLSSRLAFPRPEQADEGGLLAVGGDLRPERLLLAYGNGIFPWPHEGYPLLWFSPDPRAVLPPRELRVPRRLGRSLRQGRFRVTFDEAFDEVISGCAEAPRPEGEGTWITPEMRRAYSELHRLGLAHSAEAWNEDRLVGGLYGISLGGVFVAESMFYREAGASKAALVTLVRRLAEWDFDLFDAQVQSAHLERFGMREWPRERYLRALRRSVEGRETRRGPWPSP